MKENNPIPAVAISPYEIILDELESRNISVKDFYKATKVNETTKINRKVAKKLESYFNIGFKYWLDLQLLYDVDKRMVEAKKNYNNKQSWEIQSFLKSTYSSEDKLY